MTNDLLPEREVLAASLFREILQEEGIAVINTFQSAEATFVSMRGTMTRIDCIAALADMLAQLRLCRVLVRTGIRVQLVRSTQRYDNSLVNVVFQRDQWRERAR